MYNRTFQCETPIVYINQLNHNAYTYVKFSFLDGTIENYEDFLATNGKVLHPNHYHMLTAKHSLLQMLGRTEGCLIQDMPIDLVSTEKL